LASLSSFFLGTCPRVRSACPALRVGLAALSCSLAGFEAMFCVTWVGADVRLVGMSSYEGFACAHLCPITAISSPRSRLQAALSPSRSTWLLVGKAGWLASGTRGRLICQLRQFRSSHGSYERRALFQELYFFLFFSPCLLPFFWPPFRRFPWPGSSCCVTVVVFAGVACVGVVVNVS